MAPGELDPVQSAAFFVHAETGLVSGHATVRVVGEKLVENDLVRPGATDREGVAHHRPLRFAKQAEDFSQIMDQAGQDEPAGMAITANLFGGLEQMLELGQVRVRVAVVHQRVQKLHRLPNPHFPTVERQKFAFLRLHEIKRLIAMVQAIEFPHRGPRGGFVVAKFFLFFAGVEGSGFLRHFRIAFFQKILPLLEILEWRFQIGRICLRGHKIF